MISRSLNKKKNQLPRIKFLTFMFHLPRGLLGVFTCAIRKKMRCLDSFV